MDTLGNKIDNIIEKSYIELNNVMDNWCKNYDENFSGGKMRGDRGEHIENFVKNVVNIFTLEDSIKEETKLFTDYEKDNVCDDIFYMLDGKRASNKPIYDKKHKKNINKEKFIYFIKTLQTLLISI
jgi:hypothetical protein